MTAYYLCRICLTEDTQLENMQPLFDNNSYCVEILEKIEECGGVALKPKDGFPAMICSECMRSLNISHKFRTMCQSSETALLEALANTKSEIKDEPEELCANDSDDEADIFFNEIIEAEEIELAILTEKNEFDSLSSKHSENTVSEFLASYSENEYIDDTNEIPLKSSQKSKSMKKNRRSMLKQLSVPLDNSSDQQKSSNGRGRKKQYQGDLKIMCEICGNIYTKRHSLKSHMRVHLNEKPFECEICNKKFARTSQIRRHMRVHTGKKPFVCKFCGRAFGDQSSHVKHERIHTKERPFSCNACGKSFTYSNVLKNHMLTHTGEKPFSCNPCNKHFTLKHQLEQHIATLTHQQTVG